MVVFGSLVGSLSNDLPSFYDDIGVTSSSKLFFASVWFHMFDRATWVGKGRTIFVKKFTKVAWKRMISDKVVTLFQKLQPKSWVFWLRRRTCFTSSRYLWPFSLQAFVVLLIICRLTDSSRLMKGLNHLLAEDVLSSFVWLVLNVNNYACLHPDIDLSSGSWNWLVKIGSLLCVVYLCNFSCSGSFYSNI